MYFDNNGTTFLLPEVRERLQELLRDDIGNPAALSTEGRRANDVVETARENIAQLIRCESEQIMFTSSGSEANVAVIRSAIRSTGRKSVVISEIEHSSTLSLCDQLELEGIFVRRVRVTPDGTIDVSDLESAVNSDTAIVSVQMVNNETGIVQPYKLAAAIAHRSGALYHADAAQAVGKMPVSLEETGADYMTFTGHKFHGPQGIGAIASRIGWDNFFALISGGSQEYGKRGGTHNVISIAGIGAAAEHRYATLKASIEHMRTLRDTFESQLLRSIPDMRINGNKDLRVCNTSNLQFPGIDGKALYLRLLAAEMGCSQSSACTAQIPEPSKVLRAMGLTIDQAFSSVRFSFSVMNKLEEISQATEIISRHFTALRQFAA